MKKGTSIIRSYSIFLLSILLILGIEFPNVSYAIDVEDSSKVNIPVQSTLKPLGNLDIQDRVRLPKLKNIEAYGLNALSNLESPQNFVLESDSAEPITVIVELESEPITVYEATVPSGARSSLSNHTNVLRKEHSNFKSAVKSISTAQFNREYTKIFNGYSITLPANEVDQLLELPGVKSIYPNDEYHALDIVQSEGFTPSMDVSAPFIGADKMWESGYTGKGVKVAVIDTGIDYNHPSLKDAYKSGYDFVDDDSDPMETLPNATKPIKNGKPYDTSHGTHVSGTIVGQGDPEHPDAGKGWVRGVAPGADLYVYRVLGPYGTGTTEDIIAAIEESIVNGMDIINLSLGSNLNNQYSATSKAADNATLAGVNVVLANGNNGPKASTVGSPASAQLSISVGASSPPVHTPVFESTQLGRIYAQIATYAPELTPVGQDLDLIYANLGSIEDYKNLDVTGKTVLVSRGVLSFGEKAINATTAGAKALIIHNNTAGEIAAQLGAPGNYVPTYTINQANGLALKDEITSGNTHITFSMIDEQDLMGDFSSRGPSLPSYSIKPDLSAPGVGIRSSIPSHTGDYSNAYEDLQGTSMAAPHIAGAVALMLEKTADDNLDLDPDQIKSLLANNSVPIKNRQGEPYSVNEQGAGRVSLVESSKAEAIVKVKEPLPSQLQGNANATYFTSSASFGQQRAGSHDSKLITIDNISNTDQEYDVDVVWYNNNGVIITSDSDKINLNQGTASNSFNLEIDIPAGTPDGEYDGQVVLTQKGNGHQLRVPFAAFVGGSYDRDAITDIDFSEVVFSPNGDDVVDTTDISFAVNTPLNNFFFIVYDGNTSAPLGYTYYSPDVKPTHEVDYHKFTWEGTIFDLVNDTKISLTDGYYIIAPALLDTSEILDESAYGFLVDLSAPEIDLDSVNLIPNTVQPEIGTISGDITDDLQFALIDPNTLLSELVSVAVAFDSADGFKQVDGIVDEDGHFKIDVPLQQGETKYYLFVYDSTGNGLRTPAKVIQYPIVPNSGQVNLSASKKEVHTGESFDINVNYAVTEAVYSAAFNLTFDSKLTLKKVISTVTDDVYTDADFSLLDITDVPGTNKKQLKYKVSLPKGGSQGSLVQLTFIGSQQGIYSTSISNVTLRDINNIPIQVYGLSPADVKVTLPTQPNPDGSGSGSTLPSYPTDHPSPTPKTLKFKQGSVLESDKSGKHTAVFSVSSSVISEQLKNADAKVVTLDISDVSVDSYDTFTIHIDGSVASQLQPAKKDLVIVGKGFEITIPYQSIANFTSKDGFNFSLSFAKADSSKSIKAPEGGTAKQTSPVLTIHEALTKLTSPIKITLNLDKANYTDLLKVGVYSLSSSHIWTHMGAGHHSTSTSISFSTTTLGSFTSAEVQKSFRDVLTHWAKHEIEILASQFLVTGKGTTSTFKPNDQVNQAEFNTILDRLQFSTSTWADRIAEQGARNNLTREEATILLANALRGDSKETIEITFKDAKSIASKAYEAVAFVTSKGYLKGDPNQNFNPKGKLTRAEVAIIAYRVLLDLQTK